MLIGIIILLGLGFDAKEPPPSAPNQTGLDHELIRTIISLETGFGAKEPPPWTPDLVNMLTITSRFASIECKYEWILIYLVGGQSAQFVILDCTLLRWRPVRQSAQKSCPSHAARLGSKIVLLARLRINGHTRNVFSTELLTPWTR